MPFCFPLLVADANDIGRFLSVFHKPHVGVIQAARQLLSDEQSPLRQKLLADFLHNVNENIAAETRAEDQQWFEGTLRERAEWARASSEPEMSGLIGFYFNVYK